MKPETWFEMRSTAVVRQYIIDSSQKKINFLTADAAAF